MTRRASSLAALFGICVVAAALAGCGLRSAPADIAASTVFAVGDCVQIPAAATPEPQPVQASKSSCSADPSYTVGATTNSAGDCPTAEYQHLPADYAAPSTTRLCLVPNLLANNCYLMEMPIGLVEKANCDDRGEGVLVQVTQRLDVRDQFACPATVGAYAWPYPAPARTYCTQTVF